MKKETLRLIQWKSSDGELGMVMNFGPGKHWPSSQSIHSCHLHK